MNRYMEFFFQRLTFWTGKLGDDFMATTNANMDLMALRLAEGKLS